MDWVAFTLFWTTVISYRLFLARMLRKNRERLFLGKLQAYRNAWIVAHSYCKNDILVIQTLRNTIMSASFLASTSVILIMGAFHLLGYLNTPQRSVAILGIFGSTDPVVEMWKIFLIILTLSYSFFNFTWYIREINYLGFILNLPKHQIDAIENRDSTEVVSNLFLMAGIRFSMGMRGYYFLIPLFMWLLHPLFMIIAIVVIVSILLKRDLASEGDRKSLSSGDN
ncbi:hypothetical protein GF1_04050 [Desulfolithobacter dissulfuricans]|uniref:DUF599 domain-containing protein n=1 Tax=Desulfolithobacter dissulfuricans TaxID=2795293 RepID=A0A915XGZ4_9BACT|nr:hypothetical protein GF1_04050 [Desulfolithobacter dissulfuricans]